MRLWPVLVPSLASLAIPGCGSPRTLAAPWVLSGTGLGMVDLVIGAGPTPSPGQVCTVEALGWIEEGGKRGRLFLDTRKRGYPDAFPLGVGRVIQGWDEGIATMRPGGRRLLRIPPALGYSPGEAGADIPTGSTLLFEVELVAVR